MAASVLLSAENTGPTFAVGNSGVVGAPGNGVGAPGPASWNRSLDRALDEASATGCLNLSGRKLKEFPRSVANHDLTDTTRADLSRNRLPELPVEVCMFVSLEHLNLYQNCLRSLPESLLNLQALTYLNISRNQLSTLPSPVCSLPLKVLIACNNKLVSLPEELGQLLQLTELDVSCNEIQTLPPQVGRLDSLRDLNIRRNHLARLPPELSELPLVRLDFSCNKVTSIPVCYRNLRHLQSIVLDNNPLQNPPAQICIKGMIHIFKYLNNEANKTTPELPDYDRRPLPFGSCVEELYPGRPYGALDSGFNSVDSGDKRWSGNEPTDELSDLPLRVAEITKEQRQRREREEHRTSGSHPVTNGTLEGELEQIDFIDSCTGEEEEEGRRGEVAETISLSSQFMAYIERRITGESSPVKSNSSRDSRTDDPRRHNSLQNRTVHDPTSSASHNQRGAGVGAGPSGAPGGGVERVRRMAQLAALRYEEERQKSRSVQRDAVMTYVKHKVSQSPTKLSPTENENAYPSRRSTHTDDSALFMSEYQPRMVFEVDTDTNTIKRKPGTHKQSLTVSGMSIDGRLSYPDDISPACLLQQGDDRSSLSPTALQSPSYPGPVTPPSCWGPAQRPDSFLFRLSQKEEQRRGDGSAPRSEPEEVTPTQPQGPMGEEAALVEQLRKNIESRLKVSLPSDLGAALTDGVVLCHLANHVRPRSVPSIHVPSPAVVTQTDDGQMSAERGELSGGVSQDRGSTDPAVPAPPHPGGERAPPGGRDGVCAPGAGPAQTHNFPHHHHHYYPSGHLGQRSSTFTLMDGQTQDPLSPSPRVRYMAFPLDHPWHKGVKRRLLPHFPLSHTGAPSLPRHVFPNGEREQRDDCLSPSVPTQTAYDLHPLKTDRQPRLFQTNGQFDGKEEGSFYFLIVSCLLSLRSPSSFYVCSPGIVKFYTIIIINASHIHVTCYMSDPCMSAGSGRGKGSETRKLSK